MAAEGGSHESTNQTPRSNVREQDRFLPMANISRIMKKALPPNGKTTKEAKETMQEFVSEFISFITSETSDMLQKEKRKTINGDDIVRAMTAIGFDDYIEPLRLYMRKYREGDDKDFPKGEESSGKIDASGLQGGNLSGSSMQGDLMMLHQDLFTEGMSYINPQGDGKGSAKGAESSGKRDAGGLQGGNLSGSSMQGDMKMLQQGSFTEGMSYINPQYHNGDLSS